MVEGARLESVYTVNAVSRVRIPLPPPLIVLLDVLKLLRLPRSIDDALNLTYTTFINNLAGSRLKCNLVSESKHNLFA